LKLRQGLRFNSPPRPPAYSIRHVEGGQFAALDPGANLVRRDAELFRDLWCLLIAETSCEQHNDFLDRALVVPTLENLGVEFFNHAAP